MGKKSDKPGYVSLIPGGKLEHDDECAHWDQWTIPARDSKGHHTRMYCKVPPALLGQVQMMIDSKKYPFKSVGYFYRWCFVLGLNTLRGLPEYEDGVGSTIHGIIAMNNIVREEDFMDDFRSLFDALEERVIAHQRRGNEDRAKQIVLKLWAEIKQLNDDFWRTEFENELRRRYGNLLAGDEGRED
jgi:hypothetical protein